MRRAILGALGALLLTAGAVGADNVIPLDQRIPWQTDYRAAAEQAAKERKLVLLHFESDDCAPCRRLEANVFSRPEVAAALAASYVPVRINVGRAPEMARRYSVASWPQDVIVTPMGQEIDRRVSPQRPEDYVAALKTTADRAATLTARSTPAAKPGTMQPTGYQQPAPKGKTPSPDLSSEFESPLIENGSPTSEPKTTPQAGEYTARPQTNPYLPQPSSDRNTAKEPVAPSNDTDYVATGPVRGHDDATEYQPAYKPASESPARPTTDGTARSQEGPAAGSPSDKPAEATPHKAPILPPIGIEGYCVVTVYEYNKKMAELQASGATPEQLRAAATQLQGWVKGSKKFGAIHRGRLYLFASAAAQKSFLADPDRYAPALSGYDAVVFRETGKLVEGKRAFGLTTSNGQIYLFADKASLERFEATPNPYAETVYQAMLKSDEASKRR